LWPLCDGRCRRTDQNFDFVESIKNVVDESIENVVVESIENVIVESIQNIVDELLKREAKESPAKNI
jgi:type III secretory pathway lipoprotein EscJ